MANHCYVLCADHGLSRSIQAIVRHANSSSYGKIPIDHDRYSDLWDARNANSLCSEDDDEGRGG